MMNMTAENTIQNLTKKDFESGLDVRWCPGCGDYAVLSQITKLMPKLGIPREKKDLEFVMANGQRITRSVGFAIVRVERSFTVDEVVFAEKGDLLLLGARTLEGLSLAVDSRMKKLVAAGPLPAA